MSIPSNVHSESRWWKKPVGREALFFYLCVSPFIVGFIVFTAGPMIASVVISLTNWDFISEASFAGLENYVDMFSDELFYKSLRVTATYTFLSVPLASSAACSWHC